MQKQLTRAIAHDASSVPGELALCCINEGEFYRDHMRAARYDREGVISVAANLYMHTAATQAARSAKEFGDTYTATDILAAAVELSVYYRAHLAECE